MSELVAGKNLPWKYIAGFYLRLVSFLPVAKMTGDRVGPATLGAYGLVQAELPNPEVELQQRILTLPVENKSDYKSLYCAHLDSGIKTGTNELVLLYEYRRGFFGGRRPCFHVAAYPTGTWNRFFDAVDKYASHQFQWPIALFLYQPSPTSVFPAKANIFSA